MTPQSDDPPLSPSKPQVPEFGNSPIFKISTIYHKSTAQSAYTGENESILQTPSFHLKKIYLPAKYKTFQTQGQTEGLGLLALKKAHALKKQKKIWFQTFPNQTFSFGTAGTKVLKLQIKNKTYFFKNNKYFKNQSQATQKKYFILI